MGRSPANLLPRTIKTGLKRRLGERRGWFFYFGTKVYFPPKSLIFQLACKQDIYEREIVDLLVRLTRPNTTVMDVGANIGLMSVALLKACPAIQVLSFEPSINSVPYLQLTHNGSPHTDRWAIVPKACGESPGTAEFSLAAPGDSACEGFKKTGRGHRTSEKNAIVEVTTLDLEWTNRGRPEVSVVKIDVEGAESQVIAGAKELITTCRPAIVLEWNLANLQPYQVGPDQLFILAQDLGYEVFDAKWQDPVVSSRHLELRMKTQENFLLLPGGGR
jgi:FkbM family methyltransferase